MNHRKWRPVYADNQICQTLTPPAEDPTPLQGNLVTEENTTLQATKLHPRTPTLGTVGLPNGPTTPQWEVECGSQKPWENGAGKVGRKKEGRVMDQV